MSLYESIVTLTPLTPHPVPFRPQELAEKQKAELEKLKLQDLSQYVIKGAESDWQQALGNGKLSKSISVKR